MTSLDTEHLLAPLSNCLIQNGDLGGEGELRNLPLIFVVFCSNYNGAPVKMVSFSTVPPPPVESETLHGRLEKGAWGLVVDNHLWNSVTGC